MKTYANMAQVQRRNQPICDLRSDTVTQPDAGMRSAMADAEVGDDVYGDDPSVNRLEAMMSERLGKDTALFVPSGTMSNLTALLAHCGRGEEVIVGRDYHIAAYEAGGASVLGGIAISTLPVDGDGGLNPDVILAEVKPDDSHHPISRLVALENTHNGMAIALPRIKETAIAARNAELSVHLDGARFFNATTELGCSATELADMVDSVSICLSKGLGTPAGSVLAGPSDIIARARRYRKMLGGGMRQAGVLAAAGLYALKHNVERLAEDHQRANHLANTLKELGAGDVSQATNMIFLTPRDNLNDQLRAHFDSNGVVLGGGSAGTIRIVLHKNVDDAMLKLLETDFRTFFG
ncbi:low-specificity L-threonine aldolase [Rhodobacteraceae bacterium]|nr:low-specificity L-threonine aldolase [Paracoccaceae bacterium]